MSNNLKYAKEVNFRIIVVFFKFYKHMLKTKMRKLFRKMGIII